MHFGRAEKRLPILKGDPSINADRVAHSILRV
jgi:hypothetical protein